MPQNGAKVGRCSAWHRTEVSAWLRVDVLQPLSRKSLWLFSALTKRPGVGQPHGFLWSILPFLSLCSASLLLPLLLCVGLWSPKVLESEWASNNSRPGSSAGLFGWQPTVPSSMCLMDSFRRGTASIAARHQAFICFNFPSLSKTGNKTGDINDLDCQERALPWKCKHFLSCLSFYVVGGHMLMLYVALLKFVGLRKLQASNALLRTLEIGHRRIHSWLDSSNQSNQRSWFKGTP